MARPTRDAWPGLTRPAREAARLCVAADDTVGRADRTRDDSDPRPLVRPASALRSCDETRPGLATRDDERRAIRCAPPSSELLRGLDASLTLDGDLLSHRATDSHEGAMKARGSTKLTHRIGRNSVPPLYADPSRWEEMTKPNAEMELPKEREISQPPPSIPRVLRMGELMVHEVCQGERPLRNVGCTTFPFPSSRLVGPQQFWGIGSKYHAIVPWFDDHSPVYKY